MAKKPEEERNTDCGQQMRKLNWVCKREPQNICLVVGKMVLDLYVRKIVLAREWRSIRVDGYEVQRGNHMNLFKESSERRKENIQFKSITREPGSGGICL